MIERNFVPWKLKVVQDIEQHVAKGYKVVSPWRDFEVHLMRRGKSHVPKKLGILFLTFFEVGSGTVFEFGSETKIDKDGV